MPILVTPERLRQKTRKGNSPKLDEKQGFECLGHSNWAICRLVSWFCPQFFPPFYTASHNKPNVPILITPEREWQKTRKGNSPKLDETICRLATYFLCHQVISYTQYILESTSITQHWFQVSHLVLKSAHLTGEMNRFQFSSSSSYISAYVRYSVYM